MRSLTDEEDEPFLLYSESLLTLAHYPDCAAMMKHCEAVLLSEVEWKKKRGWAVEVCIKWLQTADLYHLARLKKAYIANMAADKGLIEREEYRTAKKEWSKELLAEVLEARVKSEGKRQREEEKKNANE